MVKLKVPLIVAGVACILSMVIGLISGVRLLHMLGRGLVAGVGSGGFVLCARLVLEKFIPDIFDRSSSSVPTDTMDSSFGSNVNITLDDDIPASSSVEGAQAQAHEGSADAEPSTVTADPDAFEENSAARSDALQSGSDEGVALSDLPDMQAFVDSDDSANGTDSDGTAEENAAETGTLDSSGFSVSSIQTDDTNTKAMAQAVRTVLATEE